MGCDLFFLGMYARRRTPVVALPDEEERARFANRADVRAMPVFPAEGSIQMIDGVLVVHIGKQALTE